MYRFAAEWLVFKEKFRNGQTFLKDSIDGKEGEEAILLFEKSQLRNTFI